MLIGIDFDNTLACYDGLFDRIARAWGLPIPPSLETREEIRDHLNRHGHRDDFTRLQGYVYGPGLQLAQLWPGAKEFITAAISNGHEVVVVSHKTPQPILGPPYDLRECALGFLKDHHVLPNEPIVGRNVFFEDSIIDKVERAQLLQVGAFIDDLPKVFQHFGNEKSLIRILFDPYGRNLRPKETSVVSSWNEISQLFAAAEQPR